jgi:hypothetical protein
MGTNREARQKAKKPAAPELGEQAFIETSK